MGPLDSLSLMWVEGSYSLEKLRLRRQAAILETEEEGLWIYRREVGDLEGRARVLHRDDVLVAYPALPVTSLRTTRDHDPLDSR